MSSILPRQTMIVTVFPLIKAMPCCSALSGTSEAFGRDVVSFVVVAVLCCLLSTLGAVDTVENVTRQQRIHSRKLEDQPGVTQIGYDDV